MHELLAWQWSPQRFIRSGLKLLNLNEFGRYAGSCCDGWRHVLTHMHTHVKSVFTATSYVSRAFRFSWTEFLCQWPADDVDTTTLSHLYIRATDVWIIIASHAHCSAPMGVRVHCSLYVISADCSPWRRNLDFLDRLDWLIERSDVDYLSMRF